MKKGAVASRKVSPNSRVKSARFKKGEWELQVFVISIVVVTLATLLILKAPVSGLSGNVVSGNAITGHAFASYQDCVNQMSLSEPASQAAADCVNIYGFSAPSSTSGTTSSSSGSTSTGSTNGYSPSGVYQFFDSGVGKVVTVFLGNPQDAQTAVSSSPLGAGPLKSAGPLVVYIAVWGILFFSFAYVFGNFLFTKEKYKWVAWLVGLGLAAIVANFGLITKIVEWAAAITGTLGAASVFVAIGAAFALFLIEIFTHPLWSKLKMGREGREAEEGAERAAQGFEGAARAAETFRREGRR